MNGKRVLAALAAVGLFGGIAGAEPADSIKLTGTIRDFQTSHPDFESYPDTSRLGIVESVLDAEGKPTLNQDRRKWSGAVHSRDSFAQWFRNVEGVNKVISHSITLTPHPDKEGVYWFVRDKKLRNEYPRLDYPPYFFPIDNAGWGLTPSTKQWPLKWEKGNVHNFHFTYELRTLFTYSDPDQRSRDLVFEFSGDDDVWVYINGRLAVDLGGVHSQERGSINLDTGVFQRYDANGNRVTRRTIDLDLEPGRVYELALFFAERHTSESNFRIETTMLLTQPSPLYD